MCCFAVSRVFLTFCSLRGFAAFGLLSVQRASLGNNSRTSSLLYVGNHHRLNVVRKLARLNNNFRCRGCMPKSSLRIFRGKISSWLFPNSRSKATNKDETKTKQRHQFKTNTFLLHFYLRIYKYFRESTSLLCFRAGSRWHLQRLWI